MVVVSGLDPAAITTRLLADAPADQASIMANSSLGAEALSVALDTKSVKPRLVSAPTGQVRYLAVNTTKVTDEKVRAAIVTAVNREAWRAVYGGEALGPVRGRGRAAVAAGRRGRRRLRRHPAAG